MSDFIRKSLKGMSLGIYIRHIILLSPIIAFEIFILFGSKTSSVFGTLFLALFFIISTLLYPYARFAYESVVRYIMGDTIIIQWFPMMLATKIFTLYYYNTKYEKEAVQGLEIEKAVYVEKRQAWEAEKAKIRSDGQK